MTSVPVTPEIEQWAAEHGIKPEQIAWVEQNVWGTLVGTTDGLSKYVKETDPPARRF